MFIGKNTTGKPISKRSKNAIITIGKYCCIASNVTIYAKENVTIGNDVWIGSNSTILSGVNIGDGSVILANSKVIQDIEPYSIVGGDPAIFIKYRFTSEKIDNLLKIKWWDLTDEKINQYIS